MPVRPLLYWINFLGYRPFVNAAPFHGVRLLSLRGLVYRSIVCAFLAAVSLPAVAAGPAQPGVAPYAEWPGAAHRTLRELVGLAGALVDRAATGDAPASQFRIDSMYFRETLRDLMLANNARASADRIPAAFLNDMVRMAAVLDAAAECQSGRYIVCPADLMERLRRQHARVAEAVRQVTGEV